MDSGTLGDMVARLAPHAYDSDGKEQTNGRRAD